MKAVFAILFVCAVSPILFAQDIVTTNDGKNIEGLILDVQGSYLIVKPKNGQMTKIWRGDVKEFKLATFLATLLLEEGIQVRGRGEFNSVKIKTAYGTLTVPADELRGIVTGRLRKQIFTKRAQQSLEAIIKLWEEAAKEPSEETEEGSPSGPRGPLKGTIVERMFRRQVIRGEQYFELSRLTAELKDVYRFVEDEIEQRLKKTRLREEREFWLKLREEALAIEPYALEEDDLVVTKRFDILGKVEIEKISLMTPYGNVVVPLDKLLAVSFGTSLSVAKEVVLKPSSDFIPLKLTVKAGDAIELQAKGLIAVGGMEISPFGGNVYGRQIKGLEVKVGDKVIGGAAAKRFEAPCDGEVFLRFDMGAAMRWIDPDEISGEFSVTIIIHGAGIPLPATEEAKSEPSKGDKIKRLLFGSEK
jgi:hypothetical protein